MGEHYLSALDNYKRSKGILILISLCLFWIVYNHSLIGGMLFLSMERISFFVLFCMVFITNRKIVVSNYTAFREIWRISISQIFLLGYSLLLLVVFGRGTGETIAEEIINLLVFGILTFLLLSSLSLTIDQFMRILITITLIQCVVIFISLINSSFANIIDSTFNVHEYFDYPKSRNAGYAGGIACITSTGAFKLSLGLVSCVYFIQKKMNTVWYAVCFVFISFIITTVARTGLSIWLFGLLLIVYQAFVMNNKGSRKVIIWILIILLLALYLVFETGVIEYFPKIFKRLIRFKTFGLYESFFKDYFQAYDTHIPELSRRMLFGLGITSGVSGDNILINADGGYIRSYAALGLPVAIMNYIFFFFPFIRSIKSLKFKNNKIIGVYFFVLFLMGEFKEPFLYSRYMLVVFFLFILLSEKEQQSILQKK